MPPSVQPRSILFHRREESTRALAANRTDSIEHFLGQQGFISPGWALFCRPDGIQERGRMERAE